MHKLASRSEYFDLEGEKVRENIGLSASRDKNIERMSIKKEYGILCNGFRIIEDT